MKIHLQSDTHIENRGPLIEPAVSSDVCVCAGDIGSLNNLVELETYFLKIKETTDNVIWVLGNHEFYHTKYYEALQIAKGFADRHGIHLLDIALGTQDLEIDGVTFWGSTLWTDCKGADWFARKKIGKALNDFFVIRNDKDYAHKSFTVDDSIEINKATRKLINWDADVIITHHMPIMIKNPRFATDDISYAFGNTGLEKQITDCKVKFWLYGHTHHTTSMDLNGTTIVSNQHGYSSMSYNGAEVFETTDYDPRLILEI